MSGQEGVAINDVMISISNSGDPGTTLTGTCALTGDSQISAADLSFSVPQGGAPDVQTISCSSAAQGTYNASFSCSHNAAGSPAVYPVQCTVGPPPPKPPAIFGSTPASGSTVDMTAAGDVIVGGTVPPSMLTLSNTAAAGAQDLTGLSCTKSGDAAITATPAVSGASLAPGASTSVTFSCATTAAGTFSATYACGYTTDSMSGTPVTGTANYTYTCEVMPPKSVVAPQVPSGTTITRTALFGGTASFSVGFNETANQGVDGGLTCSLATGTDFVLDSTMPATIPSGGSFSVMVTGSASSDPLNPIVTDTLNCTYTDTGNTAGVDVSYPLVLRSVTITRPVNVPTLSQWGMAIMALLLLGVGMVGFRRYH